MKFPAGTTTYTVMNGDNLFNIAKKCKTSVSVLQLLNPYIDDYNISPGCNICVPSFETLGPINAQKHRGRSCGSKQIHPKSICNAKPVETCKSKGFIYSVKKCDTLYKISMKFDICIRELKKANPHLDIYSIQTGQKIYIPKSQNINSSNKNAYILKPGENLLIVSKQFGIHPDELLKLNQDISPSKFMPGQLIYIPIKYDVSTEIEDEIVYEDECDCDYDDFYDYDDCNECDDDFFA